MLLFTTIPYDEEWSIYVNGKETSYFPLLDGAFIGIDLEKEGENVIEMKFTPYGVKEGIILSLVGISIFFAIVFVKQHYHSKNKLRGNNR